jgi:predicted N-acetyltransferase YhbS
VTRYSAVEALTDAHLLDGFTSGEPSLDAWLADRARANQVAGYSRTYVTTDGKRVVGYHALSSFSILRTHAPRRARKQAPQQIPAILLGRLAIDQEHQGVGLGAALLRHAMEVTVEASTAVGVRLLLVNALNPGAAAFYDRFGFTPSPTNPLDLMVTVEEISAVLGGR